MEITCPDCHFFTEIVATCPRCGRKLLEFITREFETDGTLVQCPVCGCGHLYRQKDFNRKLGVAILLAGILLAYWTYGISLLIVTLLDIWLYHRIPEVGCCYQCGAQFRGKTVQALEPFNLSLHDYCRSLREK